VLVKKIHGGALRNLSAVTGHKALQIIGQMVMVVLVPRLFGAEDYGRFAFVLSLAYLGQMLGDFGTLDVLGRFAPELSPAHTRRLYLNLLTFKVGAGLLAGVVTMGAALGLAGWMQPGWAVLAGLSVSIHIVARLPFQLALGLNRINTWIAEQSGRQWLLLGLVLLLLWRWGFTGALLAVVLMEVVFAGVGLGWAARDHRQPPALRLDWPFLRPYLRFGASFFLANLTAVALYRSGPVLVELLTGQPAQVGYFNLALGLFLMVYITLSQFAQSLIPTLGGFRAKGQVVQMQTWLDNFVRYSWLVSWVGVMLVWLLADWGAPLVFGREFAPAAPALKWISLGIPFTAVLWAGNTAATVTGRGRVKFAASLVGLLVFVAAAIWLTPLYGAVGAALALGASIAANVIVLVVYLHPHFQLRWSILVGSGLAAAACLSIIQIMNFEL
jgi:O-antigen/teichoic acid export membrane protein